MALDNLRAFIGAIDDAGDLVRVEQPVSVDKEITEIADRCMKSAGGGPGLLFTQPTLTTGGRSRYPVAINLFGSERRMSLALGVDCLDHVGARISELVALKVPEGLLGELAMHWQRHKSAPRTGVRWLSGERRCRWRSRWAAIRRASMRRRRHCRPRSTNSCSRDFYVASRCASPKR